MGGSWTGRGQARRAGRGAQEGHEGGGGRGGKEREGFLSFAKRWRWSAPNGAVGQISASCAGSCELAGNMGQISVVQATRPRFGSARWPIGGARRRPSITLGDVRGGDVGSALAQLPLRRHLGEDWRSWRQKSLAPKCDSYLRVRARKWSNFCCDSILHRVAWTDASAPPRRCDPCAAADKASPNS